MVIRELDGWLQVEPPAGTYAFIASSLIAPADAAAPVAVPQAAPAPPPPTATARGEEALAKLAPAEVPAAEPLPVPAATTAPVTSVTPAAPPAVTTPEPSVPAPDSAQPRQVLREGIVRRSWNVQSPGHLELRSLRGEGTLDHLISDDPDLDLRQFRGRHVFVTGEEWRDSRWRTPVLKVKSIQSAE